MALRALDRAIANRAALKFPHEHVVRVDPFVEVEVARLRPGTRVRVSPANLFGCVVLISAIFTIAREADKRAAASVVR